MHYIVGTQITITGRTIDKIQPGMTSQQIRASSSGRTKFKKERSLFESNRTYTLARVYKKDQIIYEWTGGTGPRVVTEFQTIKAAEEFISEIKGEQIPQYSTGVDRTD